MLVTNESLEEVFNPDYIDQGIFFVFINRIEMNISESIHIISQLVNYSA